MNSNTRTKCNLSPCSQINTLFKLHTESCIPKLFAVTFYMALGMAFKFIVNYVFVSIPAINIYGALIGNAVGFGVPVVFSIIYIQKHLHTKINLRSHIARPLLSSICMTGVVLGSYIICNFLFGFGLSGYLLNAISAVIAIVLGILTYFYVLMYCGGITTDEFDIIPSRFKRLIPVKLTSKYK